MSYIPIPSPPPNALSEQPGGILEENGLGNLLAIFCLHNNIVGAEPYKYPDSVKWIAPIQQKLGSEIKAQLGKKNIFRFTHVGNDDYHIKDNSSSLILKIKDDNYVDRQSIVLGFVLHDYMLPQHIFRIETIGRRPDTLVVKITHKDSGLVVASTSNLHLRERPALNDAWIIMQLYE